MTIFTSKRSSSTRRTPIIRVNKRKRRQSSFIKNYEETIDKHV